MYDYETVSEAVNGLRKRGFNLDFNLQQNSLVCMGDKLDSDDFEIVEFYRYEGDSDPSDEAIVYAIESKDGKRGVLVNGYGISSETMGAELAKKLSIHRN